MTKPAPEPLLTPEQLARDKRELAAYFEGIALSEKQSDAYRCVAGLKMIEIKPQLPHGNHNHEQGFQTWIERTFPRIEYRTCARYMEYAREVVEDCKKLPPAQRRPLLLAEKNDNRLEELTGVLEKVQRGLSFSEYLKSKRAKRNKKSTRLTPEEKVAAQIAEAKQFHASFRGELRMVIDDLKSKKGILGGIITPADWREDKALVIEFVKLIAPLVKQRDSQPKP